MRQIVLVGISHKTAPVEFREKLSFSREVIPTALLKLRSFASVEECMILSTCNRVEIYAVTDNTERCVKDIRNFLHSFHEINSELSDNSFYTLMNDKAVKHIYRVASSIDSMVIGEPQILGQVKDSYQTAFNTGTTGIILNRLVQSSFFVAKKVRSQTKIGSYAVSVGYLTVELARRIFEDLSKRSVMLVGTGEMGELTARHLLNNGVKELYISSKTLDNAVHLSQKLSGIPVKLEEIYYRLKDVDILITATGSADFIIKEEHIEQALKLRKNEPMFLIDIAVPRDIDPRIEDISGAYLYDVDDLQNVMEKNLENRLEQAKKAEKIVNRVAAAFENWMDSLKILPTIIDLKTYFENVQSEELNKALRKLGGIGSREKMIIEQLSRAIIEKLMHSPITRLKRESSTSLGVLYTDAVKELFDMEGGFDLTENIDENTKDWNEG